MAAAGVGKPEQLRDLVERLAGGVVARGAEHAVRAPLLDVDEQRVSARHEQRGERRHGVRVLERRREQVPFHVMHADERRARPVRERLAERHADEQRADESRPVCDGDGVDVA